MASVSAVEEKQAHGARIRWAKIEDLGSGEAEGITLFASLSSSLFGRGKQRSVGREVVAEPLPYSPRRGTYAYEALQRRFKELDKENAGLLWESDLKLALKSLNLPASEKNVQGFLESLDGGAVPFDQFAQYAVNSENLLFDTFKELDKKNTGYLTVNELKTALQKYSFRFSDRDLQDLANFYGKAGAGPFDHDQLFDFADYRNCLMVFSNKDLRDPDEAWGRAIADVGDIDASFPISLSETTKGTGIRRKEKLVKHLVAGAFTSAVTRTLVSPLERLKMLSMADIKVSQNPIETLKTAWRDEGFPGLLRGNLLNVARIIPTRVTEFLVYENLKDAMLRKRKRSDISNSDRLLLGSIASMAGIIASYPLDTLRTVLASQSPNRHIDDYMMRSILDKGFVNFYSGLLPNLARAVPYNFITFAVFDQLQERYRKKVGPGGEIATSVNTSFGILAAVAAQTVVHPLEVVQRRLQVESATQGAAVYQNMMNAFQVILEKEGVGGLYSGLAASYIKIVPATAISLVLYRTIKQTMDKTQTR